MWTLLAFAGFAFAVGISADLIVRAIRDAADRICCAIAKVGPQEEVRKRALNREVGRHFLLAKAGPCADRVYQLFAFIDDEIEDTAVREELLAHMDACEACGGAIDAVFQHEAENIRRLGEALRKPT